MKLILLLALSIASQSTQNPKPEECPMHAAHTQMSERGEKGMGFSQTATTHHFYLNESGGFKPGISTFLSSSTMRFHRAFLR